MDWADSCRVARARVLVLHAMIDAGFEPTARQLRRALEPVLGDLVPVDADFPGGRRRRRGADGRWLAELSSVGSRVLLPTPATSSDRAATVDTRTD